MLYAVRLGRRRDGLGGCRRGAGRGCALGLPLPCRRLLARCLAGLGNRRDGDALAKGGDALLERRDAVGKGLECEVALGTSDPGEGYLEDEPLVGRRAHLARGVAHHHEGARQPVDGAKLGRLRAKHLELLVRRGHHAGLGADGGDHIHVPQVRGELARELQQVPAGVDERRDGGEERGHVPLRKCLGRDVERGRRHLAQHVAREGERDGPAPKDAQLLERAERVSHAPAGVADHKLECGGLVGEALALAHRLKVGEHLVRGYGVEVKPLDAAEDRCGNLLRVGCAEHEHHV